MNLIQDVLVQSWLVLVQSAPFMLFGFAVAGLLKGFLPENFVGKHLGQGKTSNVFKAAIFGVPLPLCSCGVVPAAAGLRKQGASKGATTAFLISTPETGVDSIAVTWALLDPVMTILRPVAAFFTAMLAGIFVDALDTEKTQNNQTWLQPMPSSHAHQHSSCTTGHCGCSHNADQPLSFKDKLLSGLNFAFGELLADIGKWFLLGVILAGLISALLPEDIIVRYLGQGVLSMLAVLIVAVPLYVCATASTPIVAALALKGLSPGAALVFLLAGPATNIATLTVVSRVVGKRSAAVYLTSIIICSLLLGLVANWMYAGLGLSIMNWATGEEHSAFSWIGTIAALALLGLIGKAMLKR